MNNKGLFVIEMSIVLLVFITCLGFLEIISQGWTHRMDVRLCSRYVSTFYFRHHTLPSVSRLKENFGLKDSSKLAIENHETVSLKFHPLFQQTILKIKMGFYLWTKSF